MTYLYFIQEDRRSPYFVIQCNSSILTRGIKDKDEKKEMLLNREGRYILLLVYIFSLYTIDYFSIITSQSAECVSPSEESKSTTVSKPNPQSK